MMLQDGTLRGGYAPHGCPGIVMTGDHTCPRARARYWDGGPVPLGVRTAPVPFTRRSNERLKTTTAVAPATNTSKLRPFARRRPSTRAIEACGRITASPRH